VEAYCGSRYLELEVLGPLRTLVPGAAATLLERWEVRDAPLDGAMLQRAALGRLFDTTAA
jgi:hypothetical protein